MLSHTRRCLPGCATDHRAVTPAADACISPHGETPTGEWGTGTLRVELERTPCGPTRLALVPCVDGTPAEPHTMTLDDAEAHAWAVLAAVNAARSRN